VSSHCLCVLFCFVLFCFVCFQDRVSLGSLGCPGACSVEQAGLKLRDPAASASKVLRLKACATTPIGGLSVYLAFVGLSKEKSLNC